MGAGVEWMDPDERLAIAEEMLGVTVDAATGRSRCPWESLHSGRGAKTDFKLVWKDNIGGSWPVHASCFHQSCEGEVAAFSKEWARKVAAAEWRRKEASEGGKKDAAPVARRPRRQVFPEEERPAFDGDALRAAAGPLAAKVGRVWLGDRSLVDVCAVSPWMFLDALYDPGETVLVFTSLFSQGDFIYRPKEGLWKVPTRPGSTAPAVRKDPYFIPLDPKEDGGVWFMNQPVDGVWRKYMDGDREKVSRRRISNVTAWRYLVLECDEEGYEREWVAVLAQLPIPIVALYSSGGKSVHALVRVDAANKLQFDEARKMVEASLLTLGADPKSMTAVRLTRLPGCTRKGRLQRLLYLDPNAGAVPIAERAPVRDLEALVVGRTDPLAVLRREFYGMKRNDLESAGQVAGAGG